MKMIFPQEIFFETKKKCCGGFGRQCKRKEELVQKVFFSNEKHLKSVNCFPLTKQLKNDEK